MKLKDIVMQYLENIKYSIKQKTYLFYLQMNDIYIVGFNKEISLSNLNEFLVSIKEKYSYSTTKLIKSLVNRSLNFAFENGLIKLGFEINGSDNKLPNNISATYAPPFDFNNESLIYILDMFGIYISSGSACNSKQIKPSLVLKNIGLTDNLIAKTIRITMPPDITKEQINYVLTKIEESIMILRLDNKNKLTN